MDEHTSLAGSKAEPSATAVTPASVSGTHTTFSQLPHGQTMQEPEASTANIFLAAQRGDVNTIRELIESGNAKATDRDEQNITPLHWAAINAQVAACRYLLEQGAEVDALGGDLVATPMQWAARNGYLYVIQLLIAHNADPTITDAQGYNTLHLVTHSSSVMPLLYLLHQPINVDSRDSQGHTSLMWAAYQGDALSVDLLLKNGANANTVDDAGLTPLHWAVVRGNRVCIRRLIESGADINAKDGEGRTARDMAIELKSLGAWKRALEEGGMNEDGSKKRKPLSDVRGASSYSWTIPDDRPSSEKYQDCHFHAPHDLIFPHVYDPNDSPMVHRNNPVDGRILRNASYKSNYTDSVAQSPYFAGIIFASMMWVGYSWLTRLVNQTQSHAFTHLVFAINMGLCAYNFFRAISLDPGVCPKPSSDAELKSVSRRRASVGGPSEWPDVLHTMHGEGNRGLYCNAPDDDFARLASRSDQNTAVPVTVVWPATITTALGFGIASE
ncbi:uncharacterized protein FIBRA_08055 [Fibroporia radiculosa]|uniref:protein S-acyltransferase n=1 Tax=Fibroporia radiculosa TaxID=599839 RepID=J4IC55_9APHY|nr:uncharacterized protein FIBRA_08055 [Fibroporia radiculosa]CCM05821.1 predicted protein [Fibroporia radiculosa]